MTNQAFAPSGDPIPEVVEIETAKLVTQRRLEHGAELVTVRSRIAGPPADPRGCAAGPGEGGDFFPTLTRAARREFSNGPRRWDARA
jgi:hypothetical protein